MSLDPPATNSANVDSVAIASHQEVRLGGYLATFTALLCLTAITVFISTLHLPRPLAISIGLGVAAIKAGLVAAIFMHLASEKTIIYSLLSFTALFFLLLLLLPLWTSPGGLAIR